MKISAAFASLTTATTNSVIAVLTHSTIALYIALGLISFVFAIEVALLVTLIVRFWSDDKALMKVYLAWRGR